MKEKILLHIYRTFANWASQEERVCHRGCATCCSQNVTITALEGQRILRHIGKHHQSAWLADILSSDHQPSRPVVTINAYARLIMAGNEQPTETAPSLSPCPFLQSGSCAIYAVRPFSCQCFISQSPCSPNQPALVRDQYALAAMITSQLIEHLGQGEYWGNMLDVLTAMLDASAYQEISGLLANRARIPLARINTLKAEPLPGFLLSEDDELGLRPLLDTLMAGRIEGKTVEAILNGR